MARKKKEDAEAKVKQVRRHTRKRYSAEDKIRIVIEGLQGESSIAELCRREGVSQATYYKWSKEFLEAGKQRLAGNTERQADSEQVKELKRENKELKHLVAELSLDNRMLKKGILGVEGKDWEE